MKTPAAIFGLLVICGCASDSPWKHETFAFNVSDPAAPSAPSATNTIALMHVGISPLFQSRSFTYRLGPDAYEQDSYASFLIAPDRAIGEALQENLGAFGKVIQPGGVVIPSLGAEVNVTKLYGDFQNPTNLAAALQIHFIAYQMTADGPGRIVLDETCGRLTSLTSKTPAALMAGWDADLRDIMEQVNSDYGKASSNDGR